MRPLCPLLAAYVLLSTVTAGASTPAASPSPVVIAIIENNGVNVLHEDFALAPGQKLVLPPGMPNPQWVKLPSAGNFQERLRAASEGPLGNLEGGVLYWIEGTRIGVYTPPGSLTKNVFDNRFHATGTTSAAVGLEHGTNPQALAIIVPDASRKSWEWLATQRWIDIVSTSYYTLFQGSSQGTETCPAVPYIKRIAEQGRLIFSASGNVEQLGIAHAPAGAPYTYQVGGVDDSGRTYVPGPNNMGVSITPTRPYETGDRFEFPAADSESLDGSMDFGGTSGATPSTAGRTATLLQHARGILGSHWTGVRDGALAIAQRGLRLPSRGPLADGRLEREEMHDLLHHIAVPAEAPSPVRYLVEGYGALNMGAIEVGKAVLEGRTPEPERIQEDSIHEAIEAIRPSLFPAQRCG